MNEHNNGQQEKLLDLNITEEDLQQSSKVVEYFLTNLKTDSQRLAFLSNKDIISIVFTLLGGNINALVTNGILCDRQGMFQLLVNSIQQMISLSTKGIIIPGMQQLPNLDINTINIILSNLKHLLEDTPPPKMEFKMVSHEEAQKLVNEQSTNNPQLESGL